MSPILHDGRGLAAVIGIGHGRVMSLARRGVIPRIKVGSRVYFNLARVAEALRSHCIERGPATAQR